MHRPPRPAPRPSSLQQFLFLKQKCKSLYNQRKRPAKLAWTTLYRKQHRKVGGGRALHQTALRWAGGSRVCAGARSVPLKGRQGEERQL